MRSILWLGMLCVVLALSSCRKADVRQVVVRVPELKTAKDVEAVTKSLSVVNGLLSINVDTNQGMVVVSYDSLRLAKMNIEHAIAGAGYAANETPPHPLNMKAQP